MSNIDKREINNQQLKAFITGFLGDPAHDNQSSRSLTAEIFRIALASLEAEAVGEVVLGEFDDTGCHPDARVVCIASDGQADWENFKDGTRLYTAPPAPITVPDENGLLPCPFCGSPAEHYPDGDMEGYSVMCGHKNGDCNSWIFGFATPEEAERSWNTRAAMLHGDKL